MKSTQLVKELQPVLSSLIDSDIRKDRATVLIQHSDLSDEVQSAFLEVIQNSGEQSDMTLAGALKVPGMSEYLDTVRAEAIANASVADIEKLTKELNDANQNVQTLKSEKEVAEKAVSDNETLVKESLISVIADLHLALRKPEINLETVSDSVVSLKEGLKDTSLEDLRTQSEALHVELVSTFSNTPKESVDDETQTTDPTQNDDNEDAKNEETDDLTFRDSAGLMSLFIKKSKKTKK